MRRSRGQGSAELMLVISVVGLAVVASASTMVPLFRSGVENLGNDVSAILSSGSVGGVGGRSGSGDMSNGAPSESATNVNGTVNGRRNDAARADALRDQTGQDRGGDQRGTVFPTDIGPPESA
jgi:hypothetical protein